LCEQRRAPSRTMAARWRKRCSRPIWIGGVRCQSLYTQAPTHSTSDGAHPGARIAQQVGRQDPLRRPPTLSVAILRMNREVDAVPRHTAASVAGSVVPRRAAFPPARHPGSFRKIATDNVRGFGEADPVGQPAGPIRAPGVPRRDVCGAPRDKRLASDAADPDRRCTLRHRAPWFGTGRRRVSHKRRPRAEGGVRGGGPSASLAVRATWPSRVWR